MRVAVVSEFYPSRGDPVLGVWAHRQALAAREAGAEVEVFVLRRPLPPRATLADGPLSAARALTRLATEPLLQRHDGLRIRYIPYLSPPRWRSYPEWGAWAAWPLTLALARLVRTGKVDLVHAHNAVPAGDAARRALAHLKAAIPLVVSVHGGDVLYTAHRFSDGASTVARTLGAARLTLANSAGIAELARDHGAGETTVVHLGADIPDRGRPSKPATGPTEPPTLITVGHLVARKRHADVLKAVAVLAPKHPELRYTIVGAGPELEPLRSLARTLGVSDRIDLLGQLPPAAALHHILSSTIFVMPSTEEAFGVAYIEAMAAGIPAIGCRGEPGPEEIAALGSGLLLVPPGDIERLSQRIDELLANPPRLREAGRRARQTVADHFTWRSCGQHTVSAYHRALL